MSFTDKMEKDKVDNKKFANTGMYFKFLEGANQFRIITEPEVYYNDFKKGICYEDCGFKGSPKYMCYILDRADGGIKLANLPFTIAEELGTLERDEDYTFEGFPMPYDLKVEAKNAGTKEVDYKTLAKGRAELNEEELKKWEDFKVNEKFKTAQTIIEEKKAENKSKAGFEGSDTE